MASAETKGYMISAIVPTIGRLDSLKRMLQSLYAQTRQVDEVIVADGSSDDETRRVVDDPQWRESGLVLRHVSVRPPNAVRQRQAAIKLAKGELLLLLDDDVVLEPNCVEQMLKIFEEYPGAVGAFANLSNKTWPQPTIAWKLYLRLVHGLREGEWNGRVIGPLLRFGYNPIPTEPKPMEWLGTGNTMIRRKAYDLAGGFSDFFLHRCTINEDVDLGIKLSRVGQILFCPDARMFHHQAPGGRVPIVLAVEDDVYNRFLVMHRTLKFSKFRSLLLIMVHVSVESVSNVLGAVKRARLGITLQLLHGRVCGLVRIGQTCFGLKARNAPETLP